MACQLATAARCVMMTTNIIFVVFGVTILSLGCILITGQNLTAGYLVALFNALPEVSGSLGSFFSYVAATMIFVGAVMFLLGMLGCIGACGVNPRLLYTYSGLLLTLLVGKMTGIIVCTTMDTWIDERLTDALQTTINDDYGGAEVTNRISNAWNYAFVTYKCCGINTYSDLHSATKWNRTGSSDVIPVTCCVVPGSYPNYGNPSDPTCKSSPTTENSYASNGCYDKIKDFLDTYAAYIIGVGSAILFLELITIISAFLLSRQRKKTEPLSGKKNVHFR
ncbi:tetraspanin-1-like [Pecten maximus]|uniref:tetraspanin-1-like n=1 Tax=Pecten maximus TaxID=6579 RepID=UPI0014591259|nr:tetraspanin-1-like [Pecten maximus]